MSFQFACQQCGQPLMAEEQYVGMTVQCPHCATHQAVPQPPGQAPPLQPGYGAQPAQAGAVAPPAPQSGYGQAPPPMPQAAPPTYQQPPPMGQAPPLAHQQAPPPIGQAQPPANESEAPGEDSAAGPAGLAPSRRRRAGGRGGGGRGGRGGSARGGRAGGGRGARGRAGASGPSGRAAGGGRAGRGGGRASARGAGRGRASGRRGDYDDEDDRRRGPARKKSNTGMIIGLSIGGVALIAVLLIVLMSGNSAAESAARAFLRAMIDEDVDTMEQYIYTPDNIPFDKAAAATAMAAKMKELRDSGSTIDAISSVSISSVAGDEVRCEVVLNETQDGVAKIERMTFTLRHQDGGWKVDLLTVRNR